MASLREDSVSRRVALAHAGITFELTAAGMASRASSRPVAYRFVWMTAIRIEWPVTACGRTETPAARPLAATPRAVCDSLKPTLTGHPDFPEAAAEARWPSVSFAATKLPLVNSRLRPSAARPPLHNPAILMAAGPRNLSLPQARRSAVLIPSDGLVVRRRCRAGRERR